MHILDSTSVRRDLFDFKVKRKQVADFLSSDEPGFFQLYFSPDNGLTTLLKPDETVHVSADANDLIHTYRVQGPEDAMLMWQLDSALAMFAQYTDTLLVIYQYYMDVDSIRSKVNQHYNQRVAAHQQFLRYFIMEHPHSFSSIIAFYQSYNNLRFFDEKKNADLLRTLTDSLSMNYPNSRYVRYLQSRTR